MQTLKARFDFVLFLDVQKVVVPVVEYFKAFLDL